LRDLVICALSPRMKHPNQIQYADDMIASVRSGERRLSAAVRTIAVAEVQALKEDKAFRLQVDFALLGCALHAAGEGVMFKTMVPPKGHVTPGPADLLNLIAKALVIASADPGDGRTLDETLNELAPRVKS
jgi:hypothetical protein